MIQRIQTLYLLIAALLLGMVFLLPLVYFSDQGNQWTLYAFCVKSTTECGLIQVLPIALINGLALVISIFTIFSFKNRSFQIKLCKFNYIVLVVLLVIMGIYLFRIQAIIQVEGQAEEKCAWKRSVTVRCYFSGCSFNSELPGPSCHKT